MEFSKQEYWSGLPFLTPGDLPNSGIEPMSPALAGGFFTTLPPGIRPHVNPKLLIYPFPYPPLLFGNHKYVFYVVDLLLFYREAHLYHFVDSTHM